MQLLLELIAAKDRNQLAPLPTYNNRFLLDLFKLTPEFHDQVGCQRTLESNLCVGRMVSAGVRT